MIGSSYRISSFFENRRLGYLLLPVKIKMMRGLPKIESLSFKLDETHKDDLVEVPRWAGEILVEMGFAEIQGESFEVEVFKALSRERIQGPTQLATLTGDFYLKMRRSLGSLRQASKINGTLKPSFERLYISAYDLITVRLSKLLYLASSSSIPQDLFKKIPPEEREILREVHCMVDIWRKDVIEGDS